MCACSHKYILMSVCKYIFVVVQLLSRVWLFVSPCIAAHQAPLSFTISWGLLKFMPIELVMLSNHLILCHPLLLLSSIFPSIRVFYTNFWKLKKKFFLFEFQQKKKMQRVTKRTYKEFWKLMRKGQFTFLPMVEEGSLKSNTFNFKFL